MEKDNYLSLDAIEHPYVETNLFDNPSESSNVSGFLSNDDSVDFDGTVMIPSADSDCVHNLGESDGIDAGSRSEFLKNPFVQAEIVYDNYIKTSGRLLSGKEKRRVRREIERNAMKGRYMGMFMKEIDAMKVSIDEKIVTSNFSSLNS